MSQEELSGRAQMKRSSIANIETGRQRPPLDAIYRIALALEVSVHDLIPEMDQLLADDVKVAVHIDGREETVPRLAAEFIQEYRQPKASSL
jgi:transcriptional regulator with XRE-family HTH domain